MKRTKVIEVPELYFERKSGIVLFSVALSVILIGGCILLFTKTEFEWHGYALILIPPACVSFFQSLIYLLNPYALIFNDRIEVNPHMFKSRTWYFNDIKKVGEVKNNKFTITYNDDEIEKMDVNWIKSSQLEELRDVLHKKVYESLVKRDNLN